jgi:hypothetical protein
LTSKELDERKRPSDAGNVWPVSTGEILNGQRKENHGREGKGYL